MSVTSSIAEAYRRWQTGDTDGAAAICREIVAASPREGRALHLLGVIARAQGKPSVALEYFERSCAPVDAPAGMLDDLVELYQGLGRLAEAEATARRALAAPGVAAVAWHRLALVLIAAGKLAESRAALETAIEHEPGSVEARNNLGIVLQRLGDLPAAADAYEGALALDAENAAAHANLASVLGELGRFEAALDHARRAVARAPGLVGAYVYAALAEAGLARHAAALDWLDRAVALAPNSSPVLNARAEALRRLDRVEEGLASCRQAVALAPEDGEAKNMLGLLCHALGRDEEAIEAFEAAARLLPHPGVALANKATVMLELGRSADGAAALADALAAEPELASAWYARADMTSYTPGHPDIDAMERVLASDGSRSGPRSARQRDEDRLLLHYALAKAYLDIKDAPRAFHHLNQGSRRKRATFDYDVAVDERWMASVAAALPSELFAALRDAGEPSETPIFILGMPRSGTTLVQQILAALPGVHAAGEPRHLERVVGELGGPYPGAVAGLTRDRLAALGRRYLALATAAAPAVARRIIDKMPNNFRYAGLIHLMVPGARIIHCRRNPVDTCFSCYSKLFTTGQEFSYDLHELGRYYVSYATLMAHWRAVLPADRFIEIDYETVVGNLETEARRLVAFCGLSWDDACLSFHQGSQIVRTASMNQVRRPLYASSVARWEAFRGELGPLLEALGIA
jgi:tetratricopeptide (TPR) repeat protein